MTFITTRLQKTDARSVFVLTIFSVLLGLPTDASGEDRPAAQARLSEIDAAKAACSALGDAVTLARVQQGNAEIVAAEVLPNPDLVFNDNRSLTGPKDHETIIGLSVPLGLGGGRFVRQHAAAAAREAALLSAGQTAFEVALDVRERFARASLAAARLAVLDDQQNALGALIERVEKLAAGGEAASYDILRLRSRQRASHLQAKPLRATLEAERRWLETLVGGPVAIDAGGVERLVESVSRAQRDTGEHPAVAGLAKQAEAARLRAEAAERSWAPDIDLFAGYRMVGGLNQQVGHGLSVNLTVPLTFFDHGQGEARRARARAALNEAQAAAARRRFEADKQRAAARDATLLAADDGMGAVEVADRWVAAASKLYQTGEGSLLDVLEAFQARTEAKLGQLDVLEQRVNAKLEWLSLIHI